MQSETVQWRYCESVRPDGFIWTSPVSFTGPVRHAVQGVIAGYTGGARAAYDDQSGRVLYAIDERGREDKRATHIDHWRALVTASR